MEYNARNFMLKCNFVSIVTIRYPREKYLQFTEKCYWQPFFDPKQAFFYLLEPLEVPNPDKTPKVNVKTEGLPGNFLVI